MKLENRDTLRKSQKTLYKLEAEFIEIIDLYTNNIESFLCTIFIYSLYTICIYYFYMGEYDEAYFFK